MLTYSNLRLSLFGPFTFSPLFSSLSLLEIPDVHSMCRSLLLPLTSTPVLVDCETMLPSFCVCSSSLLLSTLICSTRRSSSFARPSLLHFDCIKTRTAFHVPERSHW